jgi:cytochrome P450 family 138
MNFPAMASPCETASRNSLSPPRVRLPKLMQGIGFAFFRRRAMRHWIRQHGRIFEINVPFFGRSVVVSDPALVRTVCTASTEELVDIQPNLGNLFGPGSVFGFDGTRHRDRRRLLTPAFHGPVLKNFERAIQDETLRECANWPEGEEFRILEPMNRITLNVILRTIFGADGPELAELREIVPPFMKIAQFLAFVPAPPFWTRRYSPWRKLDDFREAFDRIVSTLIARANADPGLVERADILAFLLRSRRDDETAIPRRDLCDELLTLVCAGHETTAAALAWTFERLRRHPDVLAELTKEIDDGGSAFRRATIFESLRVRSVVDVFGRRVSSPSFELGEWRIPDGRTVLVRISDLHENPQIFAHPEQFDPHRFHGAKGIKPAAPAWMAFGGGARRCIGADFTLNEMDIVLRTVLQNFAIHTDATADEKSYFRGVAHIPKLGGRVSVTRRT